MSEPREKQPDREQGAIHPAFAAWEEELSRTRRDRLSVQVNVMVVVYLERLAERYGLSKATTIEKLVLEAHDLHYYAGDDDDRYRRGKCACRWGSPCSCYDNWKRRTAKVEQADHLG